MKKLLLSVLILLTVSSGLFARGVKNEVTYSDAFYAVDEYLANNFSSSSISYRNRKSIADQVALLTEEEKSELYAKHSVGKLMYLGINAASSLSVGSCLQKDYCGAYTTVSIAATGIGLSVLGTKMFTDDFWKVTVTTASNALDSSLNQNTNYTYSTNVSSYITEKMAMGIALNVVGYGLYMGAEIASLIRPIIFSNKKNAQLNRVLYNDNVKYSVTPTFSSDLTVDGLAMAVSLKL